MSTTRQQALDAYNQGVTCWTQGKAQEALHFYSEAIRLDAQMSNAYGNRGVVRAALRDFQGALEDYSRAIKLDPKNHRSYYNRARIRDKIGDHRSAIQDYTTAHTLSPQDEEVLCNRGIAYRLEGNYENALIDLAAALRLAPNDWIAYYNRGCIKMNMGQLDGAVDDFTRSIAVNPELEEAYHQRALTYSLAGKVTQSRADFEHILALNSHYAFAEDIKAQIERLGARQDDLMVGMAASVLMRFAYEQCGLRQKFAGFLGHPAAEAHWEILVKPMFLIKDQKSVGHIASATLDLLSRPHVLIRVAPIQSGQYAVTFLIETPVMGLQFPGFVELSTDIISATPDALYRQLALYVERKKLIKKRKRFVLGNMPLQAQSDRTWIFERDSVV